jgi:hypothetical protein
MIALNPDDESILVEIDPELLERPPALAELLKGLLAEAGPFAIRFAFSHPAVAAGSSLRAG